MRSQAACQHVFCAAGAPRLLAILALACTGSASAASAVVDSRGLVEQTIADTCAIRKLPIQHAVDIRPMAAFQGGYTKGIGSTVWERQYAQAWRQGWCAVGVYCQSTEGTDSDNGSSNRPRGLYDQTANALYVDTGADNFQGTVAHELTHALQHQNFPSLSALHLWYNRDLAAAGNTVIEGGAHVVGWSFRASRRMQLCMMTPDEGPARQPRVWDWAPDDFAAHEMFPHAFGPAISFEALLAGGTSGLDALLANPPLSTLAVLRPARAGPVDFIRLPVDALTATLSGKDCKVGLRNTVGAVGIWGLLRTHGEDAEALPSFIEEWTGDRFVHLACPNENDDELAWLSRWRSAEAADEFAERWRDIADDIVRYGGVLGAAPTAHVRERMVIVATPGIAPGLTRLATAQVRRISRYDDWIASGCFPSKGCYNPAGARNGTPQRAEGGLESCRSNAETPPAFADWLARVRRARDPSARRIGNAEALAEAAGRLGVFCATNTAGNTDLKNACRASYGGVGYLTRLDADPEWQSLPACLGSEDFRAWLEAAYYAEADRPYASTSIVPTSHGAALAVGALETKGAAGLQALLDSPPLSTLAVLRPEAAASVEFIRMPRAELAELGCRVDATDSQGVLGIWNLLLDYGEAPEEDALPPFLLNWRGDRQSFIRCEEDGDSAKSGWVWISRWGDPPAAEVFATHYRSLAPVAAEETGFPATAGVEVDRDTVWIVAPELRALASVLKDRVETRTYADFRDWRADGCFPRNRCN